MAKVGQLRAITHDLVLKSLADNVYNASAGVRRFYQKREKLDGGYNIGSPVISGDVDDTTGGWYSGSEVLLDGEKDDIDRAIVEWKQVYESVMLSKKEIMQNSGMSQILNLLTSKITVMNKRLNSRMGTAIFNDGSDPLAFGGLGLVIGTAAYGGLSASDIKDEAGNDAWKAFIKGSAGALSHVNMQLTKGNASFDLDMPTAAFMRQNVYNELWALLTAEQRILAEDSSLSGAGHDQKKALIYNGIPHLIDSHMKAQSIYYVNEEFTKLYVHKQEDMEAVKFDKLEKQNAVKERVQLMGNILCVNRRMNSSLEGITVAA